MKTYTNGNFLIDMFASVNLLCFVIYIHLAYVCVAYSFHTLWLDYEDNDFLRIICGLSPAISKLFMNTKHHRFASESNYVGFECWYPWLGNFHLSVLIIQALTNDGLSFSYLIWYFQHFSNTLTSEGYLKVMLFIN